MSQGAAWRVLTVTSLTFLVFTLMSYSKQTKCSRFSVEIMTWKIELLGLPTSHGFSLGTVARDQTLLVA